MQTLQTPWRRLTGSLAVMTLVLVLAGCGSSGGGGGGGGGATCSYAVNPADATAAANKVRLISSSTSGSMCTLQVAIGGTTTDNDYYAFAFDILIGDTTVTRFVNGSVSAGPFLKNSTLTVLAAQNVDRVAVGITKQGAVAGNGTAMVEEVVLELDFEVLKAGDSTLAFTGSPGNPALGTCSPMGPEAIDDGMGGMQDCIASTVFGAGGTISGS